MSFIAKNPLSTPTISKTPPSPPAGARGLFATDNGWHDIDDKGNINKLATQNDIDSKVDKNSITDNSEDIWEGHSNKLIPTASVLAEFVYDGRVAYTVDDIGTDEYIMIPTVETAVELFRPYPITEIPTTLSPNKQYNFGEVTELALAFPTVAEDGDVIYATFMTGETATALTIDTTNTCDIEFVPEAHTGYEVFGKFNGSIWIVNYSEYTVSEG